MTAPDLFELGLIDGIVAEPGEGAHADPDGAADSLRITLRDALASLSEVSSRQIIEDRYDKFRRMGAFFAESTAVLGQAK